MSQLECYLKMRLGHWVVNLVLPENIIGRHPFPGPGLAIRIMGAITPEKSRPCKEADAIYINEIRKAGLYDKIWQSLQRASSC